MTDTALKAAVERVRPGWLTGLLLGVTLSGVSWFAATHSPPWGTIIFLPLLLSFWFGRWTFYRTLTGVSHD